MNVYCIDFPNGKRYVGIESTTGQRMKYHSRGYSHTLVGRAVNKHKWENCNFRYLIKNASNETCYYMEKKLIRIWKLQDISKGYNLSSGGEKTSFGCKLSKESQIKRKATLKRNGYKTTKKHKENTSNSLKGKKHSRKRKLNQSKAKGGSPFKVFKITKWEGHWRNAKSYKILKTEYVGTWELKSEAAKDLNLLRSKISQCLNNKRNTHKGYIFKKKMI